MLGFTLSLMTENLHSHPLNYGVTRKACLYYLGIIIIVPED